MSDDPQTGAPLKLFNSLTRQLEEFRPVHEGEARVYTCGPTVYNYPHIGNMRAYVFADVLGRTLSWKGYKLTHVINITDVGHLTDDADAGEDKLEKAAAERAQSIWDIARHYTEAYWADIKALNIRGPMKEGVSEQSYWSIATDYVPKMIEFAKSIEAHCYELPGGLYFDTSSVAHYGALARAVSDEGESRIIPVQGKRHAADFAIWRRTPDGETRQMEWDSPWGKGAPGWHLECSVMSGELLGFPFDIHTGGIDHREIHHPNEIAQNQAFGHSDASGANIWMHNNFLVVRPKAGQDAKMSKSSGEFLRLQMLIDRGYHPLAYRLMCLQAHYRSELEFSWEGLGAAFVRLKRLVMGWERLTNKIDYTTQSLLPDFAPIEDPKLVDLFARFKLAIYDDLNTPLALTMLEGVLQLKGVPVKQLVTAIGTMGSVLGIPFDDYEFSAEDLDMPARLRLALRVSPIGATITKAEIESILARRNEARAAKDFATSDRLRDELAAQGVEVMDGDPLGWEWKLG